MLLVLIAVLHFSQDVVAKSPEEPVRPPAAQSGKNQTAAPPISEPATRDCTAPPFRLLDFLIGKWTLRVAGLPGVSNVQFERALNGCLLIEHLEGPGLHRAENVIVYDRLVEQWRYLAVNSRGDVIALMGRGEGSTVSFAGEGPAEKGGRVHYKLKFVLNDDGSVRELWEGSKDGGVTWRKAFDGTFTPALEQR